MSQNRTKIDPKISQKIISECYAINNSLKLIKTLVPTELDQQVNTTGMGVCGILQYILEQMD